MGRIIFRFSNLARALLALLFGCASDDETKTDDAQAVVEPRFILTTALVNEDVANSYVLFLESLDAGEIGLDGAREFPGFVTTSVRDGYVFIAEEEAPTMTRYEVAARGKQAELAKPTSLSFSDYGVASLGYGLNFFASPERAYVSLDASERIVWSPQDMEIRGTMALALPDAPKGFELNASYDRGMLARNGEVFQSIYAANWDELSFAAESHVAVWNSEKDRFTRASSAPCPMLDVATRDDDGNVYFSNWVHANVAVLLNPDQSAKPCAVRIPPDSTEIDSAWTRDLSELAEGRQVMNLQYAGDGKFVAAVFYRERTTDPLDEEQISAANWRLWQFDFEANEARPIEGVEWNDGGYGLYRFDEHTYVIVTATDGSETFGYQLDGDQGSQVFHVAGSGYQIGQL